MPVKDGDTVYYKIKSGEVRRGKYDAKTKMVMIYASGGEKAKPPYRALHHTRAAALKAPFTPLKSSTAVLGAPKRYGTVKKTVNDKKTSMYELKGEGIYKPRTYQLKPVFTQEGFRSLPKSEFKRLDSEVASGEGTAISNFSDKKADEYRKFLKENNAFSEGLTFQKVRPDNLQFYKNAFSRLAKKAEPVKKVEPKNIVIRVKSMASGIWSDVSDFRKLSQKEVFGANRSRVFGNEYYLAEVSSQSDKDKLKQISEGYPSEVGFFSISSINKKFGLMGEKNISHSKIRSGDY